MCIYYLYIKTHNKTGLRYLGQTRQNPYTYTGSGVDWLQHLSKFGNDVTTEVILETTSLKERNDAGRYYSQLWNVVRAVDDFGNKIWANRVPETGGGGSMPGRYISETTKLKISNSLKGRPLPDKQKSHLSQLNTGKKHTDETKAKISAARSGKPRSAETRAKIAATLRLRKS